MKSRVVSRFGLVLAGIGVVLFAGFASAANWPQFQGPNRDGISPETGLARTWPDGGPKVLWSVSLGEGYAAPVVREGEIYVLDRVDNQQDVLRCFALDSGKELWNYAYDAPGEVSHDGSRTAPTVDDHYVFSVGVLGHFTCVDRKTHQPVWSKNLLSDFKVDLPGWGVVQAPLLYKDLVIVAPQAPDAFVAAFKRNTGEVAWKSLSFGNLGYVTPALATFDGVDQVLMAGASNKAGTVIARTAGLSAEDGALLWSYEGWQCRIPIVYPQPLPDNRVFVTGGYDAGSAMIQIKRLGERFAVKEIFKTDALGSQIHPALLHQDHLYLNSNSNERELGMMCLTVDGKIKWKTKDLDDAPTFERGGLLMADNLIFNLDGKKGILYLIEPSPEGYKQLAKADLLGGKEIWAPMALSEGKLLIRDQKVMKCLDVKAP